MTQGSQFRLDTDRRIGECSIGGEKEIQIVPFPQVLGDLHRIIEDRDLMKRSFTDVVMRFIQHMARGYA